MNAAMHTVEPAFGAIDGGIPVLSLVRQAAVLARCHLNLDLVHDIQVLHRPMNKIVPLIVQCFSCELSPRYIQLILAGCPIV